MGKYDDLRPGVSWAPADPPSAPSAWRAGWDAAGPDSADIPSVELTPRELADYSLTRGLLAVANGARAFEVEVSEALDRRQPSFIARANGGLLVPPQVWARQALPLQERAALEVATASKGGELVFRDRGEAVALLMSKALVRQLGARVLSGLRGPVHFVRETSAMSAFWMSESPTADVQASAFTVEGVTGTGKALQAVTSISWKLWKQSAWAADDLLTRHILAQIGMAIDRAAIQGTGTTQPTGILNTTGVNVVTLGPNGAAPSYDLLVDMLAEIALDNADVGTLGLLATPGVRKRLQKSAAISASTGVPAWFGDRVLGEVRAGASTSVPSNLTAGTSTTICHGLVMASWSDMVLCQWGDVELIVDRYTQKRRADLEVAAIVHADVVVPRPTSFCVVRDALP